MGAITVNGASASDGWAGGTGRTFAFTLGGATQANALLILNIGLTALNTTPLNVTAITDSDGNVWHKYDAQNQAVWASTTMVSGINVAFTQEVWYTRAASTGTSLTVTLSVDGTVDAGSWSLSQKIMGIDTTQAFDQNANAKKTLYLHNNTPASPAVSGFTTSNADVLAIYCWAAPGFSTPPGNIFFGGTIQQNTINNAQSGSSNQARNCLSIGDPQTGGISAQAVTTSSTSENTLLFLFAVTGDVGPPVAPTIAHVRMIG